MVRTQIQLTEEQSEALKRVAAEQKVSVAEVIRRSIDTVVRSSYVCAEDERWQRALAAVSAGSFRSGKSDIAANHDEYLAEVYAS